ncbi:MAG: hypothetical protein E6K70_24520 [Planctomycetota bacterium]|nr:MAG: hypothetical protein E6K70_24520 [Planctomycetota bacterium]
MPCAGTPAATLPACAAGKAAWSDTRQRHPDRHAQPAGQVGGRRVHGDDQIQVHHDGRRVHERAGRLIQLARQLQHVKLSLDLLQLVTARSSLQANKLHPRHPRQWGELLQGNGSIAIQPMMRIALPDDADQKVSSQ